MTDSDELVHIVDDVPELAGVQPGPVLMHSLDGFLDAGNAAALAARHLGVTPAGEPAGRVVAVFEVDAFHDYRARRPALTFSEDHYEDYDAPRLVVRLLHDTLGTPYLLMHGPEPDNRWEAFARAVRRVVEAFGVRLTVALGAVPMAVPHTRPVMVTGHATSPELLVGENLWKGDIRVPSSAQAMLELRLGEWGHDASGFVAHIPHYVAQLDYPTAAVSLLESVEVATGLQWELSALEEAGRAQMAEIGKQVDESEEVRTVVTTLEEQYDALRRSSELPSGEELGAELERFLAGLDRPDDREQ